MAKKLKSETVQTTLDPETGEVFTFTTSKVFSVKTSSENYFITFIEHLGGFYNITTKTDIALVGLLCSLAEFNTGKVLLNTTRRTEICAQLGIDKPYLSRCLKKLRDRGILQGSSDTFNINPNLFWKGSLQAREEYLKNNKFIVQFEFEKE